MKNATKIIVVVLLAVLLVAAIGYYVYDIKINGTPYNENLGKVAILAVSLIASIVKMCTRSGNRKPLVYFEKRYAKEIGNAYSRDARLRKKLLEAIRLFYEDDYKKAISILDGLKKQRPSQSDMAVVCLFSALCYEAWGVTDSAIDEYRQLIANDNKNSTAYSNLGLLYQKNEDYDSAFDCFCNAIEADPKNHIAISNLSQFYFSVGEYRAAAFYAQKALDIVPNFRIAATLLAIIFGSAGYEEQYEYYKNLAVANGEDVKFIEKTVSELEIDLDADVEENEETQETEN